LDQNVRTEYRHLQRIGARTGTAANERRELLETILSEGHIRSELVRQFGVTSLSSRAPFISLLYHLGMLTLRAVPPDSIGYDLEIPNRVIRELQWEHLALMLEEQNEVTIHLDTLRAALGAMAVQGDIEPFLDLFHTQVLQAIGLKDTRRLDERTIKLLFMMYASLGRAFHPLSEKEFAQGYCDLFLGASRNVAGARYSWLLEFKYLRAGAKPTQIEAAFAEAEQQVTRYASDEALLPLLLHERELRAGMIVFVGTKKKLFRPWPPEPGPRPRKARVRAKAAKAAKAPPSRSRTKR
ncbi:MAG TPA: PD-(D/E)XK nuclease domain-containing protein, partial [Candidatus Nanopelagicales bacterium]|nr:PD-(D/E)XK nuclease domain-containing protein [Candidatus Nanopelagicales bacterium]